MLRKYTVRQFGVYMDRKGVNLKQAGTWDALLLGLYLDKRLPKQQIQRNYKGTKNNCVHVQVGQIMDKTQKDQKPNCRC